MWENTNKSIANLTDIELSDNKIAMKKSSLQRGLFISSKNNVCSYGRLL